MEERFDDWIPKGEGYEYSSHLGRNGVAWFEITGQKSELASTPNHANYMMVRFSMVAFCHALVSSKDQRIPSIHL